MINRIILVCIILIMPATVFSQAGYVRTNGIKIAIESFGDANSETIILIQGTGATMLHYPVEMCLQLAEAGFRVIRFDNRDIGLSTKLDSLGMPDWEAIFPFITKCDPAPLPYTLLDMAEDVTGLMDALQIEKAHIAGASMGGAIAQLLTIHFPERVLSLNCLSSSSGNPLLPQGEEAALMAMSTPPPVTSNPDSLANYLVQVYKAIGAVDDDEVLRERALGHIKRSWYPEGTTRQVAAVVIGDQCDRREGLAMIQVPVAVIHGDSDPLVSLESGKEVAASVPNASLHIIEGMGHDISLKFVDEIVSCLLNNTRRISSTF